MVKSKRSKQIRAAFKRILDRRAAQSAETESESAVAPPPPPAPVLRRVPSADEGWGPKKGEMLEVQTPAGDWLASIVVKEPLHRRWFHVYSPESSMVYKRVPLQRLRPSIHSQDGNTRITLKNAFVDTKWSPKKGEEVFVDSEGTDDDTPLVATVTKIPIHRRWVHLYNQISKKQLRRVPISRIRKFDQEEYERLTGLPSSVSSDRASEDSKAVPKVEDVSKPWTPAPGNIVHATVDGKQSKAAVLSIKDDSASIYVFETATRCEVHISSLIGLADNDDTSLPETLENLPQKLEVEETKEDEAEKICGGDYVQYDLDGKSILGIVIKVPKHRRWFHIKSTGDFESESRIYKRVPRNKLQKLVATAESPIPTPRSPASSKDLAPEVTISPEALDTMMSSLREQNINPAKITQAYLRSTFPEFASMINKSVWNVIVAEFSPTRL